MKLQMLTCGVAAAAIGMALGVPVIGTVVTKGAFRVDNATVAGNATLFEGTLVETRIASSRMELSSGARVTLGAESKARFYGDHMILEKGQGTLEKAAGFHFEARGLTFQPETGNASARVLLGAGARVEIAALTGSFRVLNSRGLLVANIGSGRALALEPQPADTSTKLTGTLRQAGGHFLLTDETTNVIVELGGTGLSKEVGHRVEITGVMDPAATPVTDASQFIRVSQLKRIGKGSAAAAAGAGGASSGGGIAISATTIAIIGGVAAAATLGGLAAAGTLSGSSPISR